MTEATTTRKTFKKSAYSIFEAAVEALGHPPGQICEAIGYGANSWTKWKADGKIPFVAGVAIEGLRRRQGSNTEKIILLKVRNQPTLDTIKALAKGLGLEFVEI